MSKPYSRSRPRLSLGTCGELAGAMSTAMAASGAGLLSALGPG